MVNYGVVIKILGVCAIGLVIKKMTDKQRGKDRTKLDSYFVML